MATSRVRLPRAVVPPFTVFVNGGRWLAMYLGLFGTYRKDDQVDVAWDAGGHPHVAHKLDVRND